ncbi:MAG: hypothetical protein V4557_10375 [Bacteroidota bacterium]
MDQHLYKYLVLHKHLNIPQLGNFVMQYQNARYEERTGLLHAPKPVLVFTDGHVPASEKAFFDFLGNEMGVDDLTAIKLFHDFSYQFRNDLLEKGSAEIKGVGTLSQNSERNIIFHPAHDLSDLLPAIKPGEHGTVIVATGDDVYVEEEAETVETKDQWWLYALVLLMLGVGALIVYYS